LFGFMMRYEMESCLILFIWVWWLLNVH
jgi:hypothetical protein